MRPTSSRSANACSGVSRAGAEIIAEDLGVVPDFVRASLARLAVPGYQVFRWERAVARRRDSRSRIRLDYPPVSVATSGTHDTEPMVIWWETRRREEREAVLAIPSIARRISGDDARARARATGAVARRARSAARGAVRIGRPNLLILPIQDVFGWRDRINQPATVGDANWTWRLPWPGDRLLTRARGDGGRASAAGRAVKSKSRTCALAERA